jgi:hypothetical protein
MFLGSIKYKYEKYTSIPVKLSLYVGIAVFSSFLTDFSHYDRNEHLSDITDLRWVVIFANALVQGLIAWRAFIDGAVEREKEKEREDEKLAHTETHLK